MSQGDIDDTQYGRDCPFNNALATSPTSWVSHRKFQGQRWGEGLDIDDGVILHIILKENITMGQTQTKADVLGERGRRVEAGEWVSRKLGAFLTVKGP